MVEHGKNKNMKTFENKILSLNKISFFFILLITNFNCSTPQYDYDIIFDKKNNSFKKIDTLLNGLVYKKFGESKIEVGYLENGEKNGKWLLRYPNNRKKEQTTYYNGIKNGLSIKWYLNGFKKVQGEFVNGEPVGLYSEWFKNGQKSVVGVFKNSVEHGPSTRWYKNGNKKQKGAFLNGKRNGAWTWWYKNGKIKKTGIYKDGIFSLEQKWAKEL